MTRPEPLLRIHDLRTHFFTESGVAKAVDGVDLEIRPGEVLGLVGESGSGKSVTALSILRLVPDPPGRIVGGEILFRGRDLLKLSWEEIRDVRGKDISMIFQEPMTSLNPVFRVGRQVMEIILEHEPHPLVEPTAEPDTKASRAAPALAPGAEKVPELAPVPAPALVPAPAPERAASSAPHA